MTLNHLIIFFNFQIGFKLFTFDDIEYLSVFSGILFDFDLNADFNL